MAKVASRTPPPIAPPYCQSVRVRVPHTVLGHVLLACNKSCHDIIQVNLFVTFAVNVFVFVSAAVVSVSLRFCVAEAVAGFFLGKN